MWLQGSFSNMSSGHTCAQGPEVLRRPGHDVAVQLHHDPADGLGVHLDVQEHQRPDLRLDLVQEGQQVGGHRLSADAVGAADAAAEVLDGLNSPREDAGDRKLEVGEGAADPASQGIFRMGPVGGWQG